MKHGVKTGSTHKNAGRYASFRRYAARRRNQVMRKDQCEWMPREYSNTQPTSAITAAQKPM